MERDGLADTTSLSRRGVLGGGLALGLGALLQACGGSATISRSTAVRPAGRDLDAIEHVVSGRLSMCLPPSGWLLIEALVGRAPGRDVARNR